MKANANQTTAYPAASTNGETMLSFLRAAVSAMPAYVMIMGAALGSIIASVMAPHIETMMMTSRGLNVKSAKGRHSAGTNMALELASDPSILANSKAVYSQLKVARTITQSTANTFGRAKTCPRPAAARGR